MKNLKDLRIAIVGGGIAGASMAVALESKGINYTIYEQAPQLSEVGAGIGIRPKTIRYMQDWNVYKDVEKVTVHTDFMNLYSGQGKLFHKEQWPVLTEDPSDDGYARFVHRADLLDALILNIPQEKIKLSHVASKVENLGTTSKITFTNGEVIEADLVIGADGIRSVVRDQCIEQGQLTFANYQAFRAVIPEELVADVLDLDENFHILLDGAVQVFLLPLKLRNQVSFDITTPTTDNNPKPTLTQQDLVDSVKNFHPQIAEAVLKTPFEDFVCRGLYDIEPLQKWSAGCITLIGDAAHAMLHNLGQGANAAIQDAGYLANALVEYDTLEEVFASYEDARRPITSEYIKLSRIFPNPTSETLFLEKDVEYKQ